MSQTAYEALADSGHRESCGMAEQSMRIVAAALGGRLLFSGLRRISFLGLGAAALGGGLVYGAVTGRGFIWSYLKELAVNAGSSRKTGFPLYSGGYSEKGEDRVEEASMESFPASDPPAHSTNRV